MNRWFFSNFWDSYFSSYGEFGEFSLRFTVHSATLTFQISVHIRLFIFRKSAALYDTIRVYTFIRFVANPPYTIFIWSMFISSPILWVITSQSELYSPFITQPHAWRHTLLGFQETVICQPACHSGPPRHQETALDKVSKKLWQSYQRLHLVNNYTVCHSACCLCLIDA